MKLLSGTLFYYGLSIGVMKGLSLIMLPLISRYLSPTQMGQLELLTTFAIFMSLFVAAGLEDCLFRFASNPSQTANKNVASSLYGWAIIFGGVFYLAAWFSAPLIASFSDTISALHLQIVWAGVAFEGAITLPLALMRMRQQANTFFWYVIGRTLLQAALTVIFLSVSATVTSILLASLCATIVQGAALFFWQARHAGIAPKAAHLRFIFRYGMPLIASGLCLFAFNSIDRITIARWLGLEQLGFYSVGAKFALATILLMQPFGMWWRPQRFSRLADNPAKCAHTMQLGLGLLAVVAVTVMCAAPLMIQWLMPQAYQAAMSLAIGVALIYALREAGELLNLGVLSQSNTYTLLRINIAMAVIGSAVCVALTIISGMWGCIAGLCLTQFIRTLTLYYFSQKICPLSFNITGLWLLLATVTLCAASLLLADSTKAVWPVWFSHSIIWMVFVGFSVGYIVRLLNINLRSRLPALSLKLAS